MKHFFVAGAWCQILGTKTASTIGANLLLRCQDAVLEILHDEAIRKMVTVEKPPKKSTKELQFSPLAHQSSLQSIQGRGLPLL